MDIIKSKNGSSIRLTEERFNHITRRHPEISDEKGKIIETLGHPDFIQEGDSATLIAIKFYKHTSMTSKYLVVVYRELSHNDGFVLTAYLTSNPSVKRRVVWKP